MKLTLKQFLPFVLSLLLIPSTHGIDLQNKVPKNALYVCTINGQNILTKMPMAELENLEVMNVICKKMFRTPEGLKLSEMGVNLAGTSYFFVEMSDSIIFVNYVFPLSDVSKFETAFIKKDKEITKDASGNKSIVKKNMVIAWNNEYGMIINGEAMTGYFTKYPEVYQRYGFGKKKQDNRDEPAIMDGIEMVAPGTDTIVLDTPMNSTDNNNYNYEDSWSSKYEQRKEIVLFWKKQKAEQLFGLNAAGSISTDERFIKSQDKTAEASLWFGSNKDVFNLVSGFYRDAFYSGFGYSRKKNPILIEQDSPLFSKENYASANLYCNTNNMKLNLSAKLDSRLVSDYSKITNAKLNKKFFNYIPGENLLGYYSFAYNTQAMLEATPRFMETYLKMFPYTDDIATEIMDLYALFIDEAAIGKLVKGDGVFAVTNLVQKEVPYTSYEYDSLYNYKEITKTRMEVIPEFVFAYSTEDPSNTDKMFSIAYKKGGLIKVAENHYQTPKIRSMPFTISFIQKDGIVFICNTKEQVDRIMKGKVEKGFSKEQIKAMTTHSANMFVDVKKILALIPDKTEEEKRSYTSASDKLLSYSRKNVGQISVLQSKPNGNTIHSEVILSTPEGYANSLKYLFGFMNDFYKITSGE